MKNWFWILMVATPSVHAQVPAHYDFIQVTGEAEMKVKPDFVLFSALVHSRAPSAQAAQKLNAKEMSRVEKILKSDFKIDEKDIQTNSFHVQPQYEYQKDRPVYKGMVVNHSLTVKFRKISEVGALLDKLLEGSGQEFYGVRVEDLVFGTDQLRNFQNQALEAAVADSRNRAQILAKSSGKTLKDVRKISDSSFRLDGPQPMREGMMMKSASFASVAADSAGGTQISAGELTVRAQIQVEFEAK